MQDATVSIIFELVERIDAAQQRNALQRAVAGYDLRRQFLTRLQVALQSPYSYGLIALQSDRLPGRTVLEGERQHAHPDQNGEMDLLEALADHGADAEQPGSLRAPARRRAVAVFGAGENHQRHLLGLILHGGIVNRHLLAIGPMFGKAAFRNIAVGAPEHEVLDADIGEG